MCMAMLLQCYVRTFLSRIICLMHSLGSNCNLVVCSTFSLDIIGSGILLCFLYGVAITLGSLIVIEEAFSTLQVVQMVSLYFCV